MLYKLHLISEKLSALREDVWFAEMLYKFISGDLDHQEAEQYQLTKISNPRRTLENMISNLYSEATSL